MWYSVLHYRWLKLGKNPCDGSGLNINSLGLIIFGLKIALKR